MEGGTVAQFCVCSPPSSGSPQCPRTRLLPVPGASQIQIQIPMLGKYKTSPNELHSKRPLTAPGPRLTSNTSTSCHGHWTNRRGTQLNANANFRRIQKHCIPNVKPPPSSSPIQFIFHICPRSPLPPHNKSPIRERRRPPIFPTPSKY